MRKILKYLVAAGASLAMTSPTLAELDCFPAGKSASDLPYRTDTFFAAAQTAYKGMTAGRYVEGDQKSCAPVEVPGYVGFPTKQCSYASVDAGRKYYKPLAAKVIVLDPSAAQLADWTIGACRVNGADDAAMPACIASVHDHVQQSNGAQFAVVGSVVESYCNSSPKRAPCEGKPDNSPDLQPRNTLFRDGVSVDYHTIAGWTPQVIPDSVFDALFEVATSDKDLNTWYDQARIAGVSRGDWRAWRKHQGKGTVPDGVANKGFDLEGAGFGTVARTVHQTACAAGNNELLDALVFNRGFAK